MTKENPEPIPFVMALIPILFLVFILGLTIIVFKQSAHIPLLLAAGVAVIVAIKYNYQWKVLESQMVHGISMTIVPMLILMLIGIMIGTWIVAGVVPAMIYYGLQVLSPKIFLVATMLICSIVALGTGSSWSTAGTVGVALIAVGKGMGIPVTIVAGAIISGAYFGDKMSPLSDTTNLAPAIAGTDLISHIKHMLYTTGPSYIIALIIYAFIGFSYSDGHMETENIDMILQTLNSSYNINLFLLIPPIVVIVLVVRKMPAMPGLLIGGILGGIFALIFQDCTVSEVFKIAYSGYVSNTGTEMVDGLLTRGGITSMYSTIGLIMSALTFGGIMEGTGMLNIIMQPVVNRVKRVGSLVALTNMTTISFNFIVAEQYVAEVVSGRMYKNSFDENNLKAKNLSRCLEDSGTLTSALVPWNTCGAFMWATLGVYPFFYAPFAFFNLINPLVSIFYGYTGITMEKKDEPKDKTDDSKDKKNLEEQKKISSS
ncbi:MAG: Na+/H+ antiporter NhaC [Victivallales bacterium]|nr:Na+/H+ antiporter NhaC [Victivallales bacterium]MCF7889491.1 Na+/H+ antiporter NhaC [Victivallales bacterium]